MEVHHYLDCYFGYLSLLVEAARERAGRKPRPNPYPEILASSGEGSTSPITRAAAGTEGFCESQ